MKTKEELNALKEEVENLNKKLAELSEEELEQVAGGLIPPYPPLGASGKPGFDGTFDGSARVVNIELDPASDPRFSTVNEKGEQKINAENPITVKP